MARKCSSRSVRVVQAWILMVAATTGGCAQIIGVDEDYHGFGGGGTAGASGGIGGTGATTTTTTIPCDVATCPAPADECKMAACDAMGQCGEANADNGTVVKTQVAGDCKKNVCMDGAVVPQNDDTDTEDDGQTCMVDTCDAGVAKHAPASVGTACTENAGKVCDGGGACVECNVDDPDCNDAAPKTVCDPGGSHVCVLPHCSNGVKDFTEADLDCGGLDCVACVNGQDCNTKADCQSNFCFGTTCAACAADVNCAGFEYCSNGACVNDLATGLPCNAGAQCLTDNCVDGVCCGSASCANCQSCAVAAAEGGCTNLPSGAPDVNAAPACVDGYWCNGAGACTTPPSCNGLAAKCGPGNSESCCAVTALPAGTYNRSNDAAYPATVSAFRLDRFEITVGRFRAFVNAAQGTQANPPVDDAATHPLIAGSGWKTAWNTSLPVDQMTLKAAVKCNAAYEVWTDAAGVNESLPMNCLTWYNAFAFCAWDGGRLPTEAEWNYAAAGGGLQRAYPWGATVPDAAHTVFGCTGDGSAAGSCALTDILKVGSKSPVGDGYWGQADLAGSVWEWNLDWYQTPYPMPCTDCANLITTSNRVRRGGSWYDNNAGYQLSSHRNYSTPANLSASFGARCARTP